MKKTLIAGSIMTFLGLFGASAAHAQDADNVTVTGAATVRGGNATIQVRMLPRPGANGMPEGARGEVRGQIQVMRGDLRADASTTRAEIKDLRQQMRPDGRSATGTPVAAKRMELKAEIESRKEDLASRRASTTAAIKETLQARVAQTAKASTDHLSQELARLSDIKAKINTRLDKMDAAGTSTVAARADLSLAVTAIDGAQAKITAVATVEITSDVKASSEALRQAVLDAQKAIDDAQKALMKVVEDMKGSSN